MSLQKRIWVVGEKAAWLADKIVTGSPEYCNEAAGLLRNYSGMEARIATLEAELLAARDLLAAKEEETHL